MHLTDRSLVLIHLARITEHDLKGEIAPAAMIEYPRLSAYIKGTVLTIFALLPFAALAAQDGRDISLLDGRTLISARVVSISDTQATIVHSLGVETLPVDSVPLDILARAYDEIKAREAVRSEISAAFLKRESARERTVSATKDVPLLAATGAGSPNTSTPENACVVMRTAKGTGTGFILRHKDGFALISNQHVIDGPAPHKHESLDGVELRPSRGWIARDRDIVVFDVDSKQSHYLEMEPNVADVPIGAELIIYGNSLGDGVRVSRANLVGKGRDQIEVSGGIVPGNSGGPIVWAKTRRVIGVSTHVTVRGGGGRTIEEVIRASGMPKVRFFGVRLDTMHDVGTFSLSKFLADRTQLDHDEARLNRAICFVAAMAAHLKVPTSDAVREFAGKADHGIQQTINLLRYSKLYPGTMSVVDVNAFQQRAGPMFDIGPAPSSYIHREHRAQLVQLQSAILSYYTTLLKRVPVK